MKCSITQRVHNLATLLEKTKKVVQDRLDDGKVKEVKNLLWKLHEEERTMFNNFSYLYRQGEINYETYQSVRNLCSVPLGEVAELVDQWFAKQNGKQMNKNPDKYGIDFITEAGMEDTKFCPREGQNFFVEFLNRQDQNASWKQSGHFQELKNNKVFLRFIDNNGCHRLDLTEHTWNHNNLTPACGDRTKGWWVHKENFEKVWEW